MAVLAAENVSYTYQSKYQKVQALKNVSCTFEAGKFYAIIGQSGSGKTTLLSMLAGLGTPSEGEIIANGKTLKEIGSERHRRENVTVIYQSFNLFPTLNILENVMYPMQISKKPTKEAKIRAKELLNSVGLGDVDPRKLPAMLSGGQQQRVAIARALATSPKILLCDEATSALDPTTTRSILALLKEINRTLGITIIVITHEMAVIEEICQRVAIIDSSRIAEVGAVDDVFTRPQSAMAKQLIYPDGKRRALATGKHYCRIVFDGNSSFEPVVSNMVLECKAPVNIMFADTKNIDGKAYGQMILQLPEDERAAKRALAYLETQNVHTEEVDANAAV